MGLFSFFKKNDQSQEEDLGTKESLPEIKESDFIDKSDPSEQETSTYSVVFGTKLPIDIIYGYLKEDYEAKAYQDALTNPDQTYKEMNLAIMRSDIEIKFKQVLLKYEDMLRLVDFHIQTRSQAGLTDIVDLLKSKKETYEKHVDELNKMKQALDNGEPYMTGIFESYKAGFIRGLASLSLQDLKI